MKINYFIFFKRDLTQKSSFLLLNTDINKFIADINIEIFLKIKL